MPKPWTETIGAHRRAVRGAILDAAWALVGERGPLSVTMSDIAHETGIGRATLYKYFPDVEAILTAWHERHVHDHLQQLAALRDREGEAGGRLASVLDAYASICHQREHHGTELAALLHRGEEVARAEQQLVDLFGELIADAARTGGVRSDLEPDELARYCLHALGAAGSLSSEESVRGLVKVTLAGLRGGNHP